jgi:phosphoglycolate phosphatase
LTGIADQSQIEELICNFKVYYDVLGYKKTLVYTGIDNLLRYLEQKNFRIMLATNKRITPTLKIINHFSWLHIFEAIYAIDLDTENPFSDKKNMLSDLIWAKDIDSSSAVYIGDRLEDQDAAHQNNLHSITVSWGYGIYTNPSIYSKLIHHPSDLMKILENDQ